MSDDVWSHELDRGVPPEWTAELTLPSNEANHNHKIHVIPEPHGSIWFLRPSDGIHRLHPDWQPKSIRVGRPLPKVETTIAHVLAKSAELRIMDGRIFATEQVVHSPKTIVEDELGKEIASLVQSEVEVARIKLDADYVMNRLARLFTRKQALVWITSYNSELGARPIDVMVVSRTAEVIAALDALERTSY